MAEEFIVDEYCLKKANDFIEKHHPLNDSLPTVMISKEVLIGNLATEVYHSCVRPSSTPNFTPNNEKSR
jgi:hypothetical protein